MKNNKLIPILYTLLADELEKREPYLSPRTRCEHDRRRRQGPEYKNTRYYIAVLDNHIIEHTVSVVFTIETAENCVLRFYSPLQPKECDGLAASGYAPVLRPNVYLSVGLCKRESLCYAYAEVKLSQYASLVDVLDTLHTLGKELEAFIKQCH